MPRCRIWFTDEDGERQCCSRQFEHEGPHRSSPEEKD